MEITFINNSIYKLQNLLPMLKNSKREILPR